MTRTSHSGPLDAHRECWELLPWIANERATPGDIARIEPHLRTCKACLDELDAQRRLREMIRTETPVVLAPQTSLHKLMKRIAGKNDPEESGQSPEDATSARVAVARASSRRRPARAFRWLPIAAAVQGIAIAGLLTAIWWQSREELTAPGYTTLTTQTTVASGPVIRVVFTQDIPLNEMSELVRSIDAQIVAGPSDAGVYTLALTGRASSTSSLQRAAARLRADARVLFSELAIVHSNTP